MAAEIIIINGRLLKVKTHDDDDESNSYSALSAVSTEYLPTTTTLNLYP